MRDYLSTTIAREETKQNKSRRTHQVLPNNRTQQRLKHPRLPTHQLKITRRDLERIQLEILQRRPVRRKEPAHEEPGHTRVGKPRELLQRHRRVLHDEPRERAAVRDEAHEPRPETRRRGEAVDAHDEVREPREWGVGSRERVCGSGVEEEGGVEGVQGGEEGEDVFYDLALGVTEPEFTEVWCLAEH